MIYLIIISLVITILTKFFVIKLAKIEFKSGKSSFVLYLIIIIIMSILYNKYRLSLDLFRYSILAWFLLIISIIDYYTMYVYDITIISAIIIQAIILVLFKELRLNYALGLIIGFAVPYLITKITKGMGEGDIGVYTLCCFCIGYRYSIYMIMLSFIIGSIYGLFCLIIKSKTSKSHIPFAPCIAMATMIVIINEYGILNWYINKLL